jgi:H+/Cl- antiporter ClcA
MLGHIGNRLLIGYRRCSSRSWSVNVMCYIECGCTDKIKLSRKQQRLLLSCEATTGAFTGFTAPITAVFFAMEVVKAALIAESSDFFLSSSDGGDAVLSKQSITAILLASVMSVGVAQQILPDHLTFRLSSHSLTNPLLELS